MADKDGGNIEVKVNQIILSRTLWFSLVRSYGFFEFNCSLFRLQIRIEHSKSGWEIEYGS